MKLYRKRQDQAYFPCFHRISVLTDAPALNKQTSTDTHTLNVLTEISQTSLKQQGAGKKGSSY